MLSSGHAAIMAAIEGDMGMKRHFLFTAILAAPSAALLAGCTPTVQIAAPDRPIEINLNVKIDQEIRVRLDREVEELIADNPDIF